MARLQEIVASAKTQGVGPWLAVKVELAAAVVAVMRTDDGPAVLQGGGAVHFAYGSPRLSVDIDYAGIGAGRAIEQKGLVFAQAAGAAVGCPAAWSFKAAGNLARGKIAITLGPARTLVLPVEACDVPAHRIAHTASVGLVEAPEEVIADKIVASALRWRDRGSIKPTDVFDIWYLLECAGASPPPEELVRVKLADYGASPAGIDVAGAVLACGPDELAMVLKDVLPIAAWSRIDAATMVARVAALAETYRHVL